MFRWLNQRMATLKERLEEVMRALSWEHGDLVKHSGQSSSAVSQWLGKGSKEIKKIGRLEAAIRLEQASGYAALWLAEGKGPKLARRATSQWPFELVAQDRFESLSERQKGIVEDAMLQALARIEGDLARQTVRLRQMTGHVHRMPSHPRLHDCKLLQVRPLVRVVAINGSWGLFY